MRAWPGLERENKHMAPWRHGADAGGHLRNALRQASAKSVVQLAVLLDKIWQKNKDCRTPSWRMLPSVIGSDKLKATQNLEDAINGLDDSDTCRNLHRP
jgi:hypothetical protein